MARSVRGRCWSIIVVTAVLSATSAASLHAAVSQTVVPRMSGGVLGAYARLHAEGFRVSIRRGFTFASVSPPAVARTAPGAGVRVSPGSLITLYLATPTRSKSASARAASAIIPSFLGQRVSAAYAWAKRKRLRFTGHLGGLSSGPAAGLLANFVVTAQFPDAGRARRPALTVWGQQAPPPPPPAAPLPVPPASTATTASASPPPPPPAPSLDTTPPATTYYQNPVYSTIPFPDPFVLDNGDTHSDYWAFATGTNFPMLRSTDLVHWTWAGTALSQRPTWVVVSGDWHPWAPSVIQSTQPCPGATSGGCYVMYYVGLSAALNRHCIGVATSSTAGGPYTDQGPLSDPSDTSSSVPIGCGDLSGAGNIDPSPYVDASGQYLYVSTDNACTDGTSCVFAPTISVIPLTTDLLSASGPRIALFSGAPNTWEAAETGTPTVEGPSLDLHNGTYYLFYSGGNWQRAYGMGYATSASPTGPFTKAPSNPIFASTTDALSVGGGDHLVTGPHGGLWMVYHARTSSYSNPRTLWLDPVSWKPADTANAPDVPVIAGPTTTPQTIQP